MRGRPSAQETRNGFSSLETYLAAQYILAWTDGGYRWQERARRTLQNLTAFWGASADVYLMIREDAIGVLSAELENEYRNKLPRTTWPLFNNFMNEALERVEWRELAVGIVQSVQEKTHPRQQPGIDKFRAWLRRLVLSRRKSLQTPHT